MPGHGIELAVACDIVHGYQGNIRITRSEFDGATFVVDLPGPEIQCAYAGEKGVPNVLREKQIIWMMRHPGLTVNRLLSRNFLMHPGHIHGLRLANDALKP
jgi:hypothetical protein